MTPEEIVEACEERGIRLVRFLYCDNGGIVRGKMAHVSGLADRIRTGIGLTVAMQAMNSMDHLQAVEGMGPVGEIRLVPDPESFVVLPYAPHVAAMLVDHVRLDGQPYEAGPRTFLKAQSDRLAQHGLTFSCAVENEFSLATRGADGSFAPTDAWRCCRSPGRSARRRLRASETAVLARASRAFQDAPAAPTTSPSVSVWARRLLMWASVCRVEV